MTYISKCEHGIAMALCQKCFPDVSEQNDWSKYVNAHPAKTEDEGKVCARCGAIAYDPVITQTAKTLTDEEIKELSEKHLDMDWQTGVIQFARAILRKAEEK